MSRIIAMIPTYNEAENIGELIDTILALGPEMEVLVVDDDSPDGTWRIVQEKGEVSPRVHLMHRMSRRGRGIAGIAGFCEALRIGGDYVIEMDADWSHDPKWIPSMVAKAREAQADVVIASRLIPGGGEAGRSFVRRWITVVANIYIRKMLRLPVHDATTGFRLFSRRCLEALPWDAMRATGPEVVQEVLVAAHARHFKIAEVPFLFVERRHGHSTFNRKIMLHSLAAMYRLRRAPGRLIPWEEGTGEAPYATPKTELTWLPGALTVPLSWLYGLGRTLHRLWHVWRPGAQKRLPVPVICVGNLTVGGTGKTPFVQFMAETLKNQGYRPAIVSRGYRAEDKLKKPLIVSDGERLMANASQAGDEPQWLAERCPGVPVVVCPERYEAGLLAAEKLAANIIVLDDGFQHDQLRRNLDLVLWDVGDPPERMRLMPAGRLREGVRALRRAGAVVLTHSEYLPADEREVRVDRVIARLKRIAPDVTLFESETRIIGYQKVSGRIRAELEATEDGAWPWAGRRVLAVSGLARPEGFEAMLRASGAVVAQHFAYADHFTYDSSHAERWREAMKRCEAEMVLTTTKDAVKLNELPLFGLPIVAINIAVGIKNTERWAAFMQTRLEAMARPRKGK